MLSALVLARILGPSSYGVVSAATIYVTLSTLILDQGLASALVQRPRLPRTTPGAVSTLNIVTAILMAAVTWFVAPLVSDFFDTPNLTDLLRVLGIALLVKALAITPRAMQLRQLRYKPIAVADVLGGLLGAVLGIAAAISGAGIWAMAWQVIATDVVIAVVLLAVSKDVRPNGHLRDLPAILPFGLRVFGVNGLAFFSRNADNILVGRFLGVASLSYYSMAYRVLVIPVQMVGQTVNRVAFPTFSRQAGDRQRVAVTLVSATELLSMVVVLPMVLVAVAAPQVVQVVLGPEWTRTAAVLSVLAVAGARETVFYITGSLMRAMGAAQLNLRYEIVATSSQLTGIVVGLQFGLVGVALGYALVGFALAPILLAIQRHLTGVPIRAQVRTIAPSVHAAVWGALAYEGVRLTNWADLPTLLVGGSAFGAVSVAVLWIFHRAALARTVERVSAVLGIRYRGRATSPRTVALLPPPTRRTKNRNSSHHGNPRHRHRRGRRSDV